MQQTSAPDGQNAGKRVKGQWKNPEHSLYMKRTWDDPVYARADRRRSGIPDGMTRPIAKRFWKQARFEATLTMKQLAKTGFLDDWTEEGKEALHATLATMRSPMNQQLKLAAAKQVLEWTQAKPAAKSHVTVNAAEEWLAAVATSNDKADEGDAGDAEASAE